MQNNFRCGDCAELQVSLLEEPIATLRYTALPSVWRTFQTQENSPLHKWHNRVLTVPHLYISHYELQSAGLPACLIGRCCSCSCSWFVLVPLFSCCGFLLRLNQVHPPFPSRPMQHRPCKNNFKQTAATTKNRTITKGKLRTRTRRTRRTMSTRRTR